MSDSKTPAATPKPAETKPASGPENAATPSQSPASEHPNVSNELTAAERDELAALRAEKAEKERQELEDARAAKLERENAAAKAAAEREALAAKKADKPYWNDFTVEEQIKDHYLHGRGSIQDYARIYKLTVEEVLDILGMGEMKQLDTTGDLVDSKELGPGSEVKPRGQVAEANFSTN